MIAEDNTNFEKEGKINFIKLKPDQAKPNNEGKKINHPTLDNLFEQLDEYKQKVFDSTCALEHGNNIKDDKLKE